MTAKDDAFSRREFVRLAGALGLGTSVAATGCATVAAGEGGGRVGPHPTVPRRTFGRTGAEVSILALGGFFDVGANLPLLTAALASGVTYWETTLRFGGKGYGRYFRQHPGTREQVFLMAKAAGSSSEQMESDLTRVLDEAGVDWIDFFVIQGLDDPDRLNAEVQRWVAGQKARGRIRHFGFSTHANMSRCLRAAAGLDWIDGVMTSYNYRLMQDPVMEQTIAACHDRGIALTAIKAQALPTNPQATLGLETAAAKAALEPFGSAGSTPFQVKLKAVWSDPRIASICSMMTETRTLRENVAAAADGRPIGRPDREALRWYAWRTTESYCMGCSDICEPTLGQMVPIAAVMRALMYARGYGHPEAARAQWSSLSPETRAAVRTGDYTLAEARCPQGMAVGQLMRTADRLLR